MEFQTHYNYKGSDLESVNRISIVDPSGYIDTKQRVENLIRAGEKLDMFRRELYHYDNPDLDDDVFMDPFADKSIDYFEAHRLRSELIFRMSQKTKDNPDGAPSRPTATSPSVAKDTAQEAGVTPAGKTEASAEASEK